jgi:hypothetical protein
VAPPIGLEPVTRGDVSTVFRSSPLFLQWRARDGAFVLWFLGIVFVVLGVVSDPLNITLVLQPISWFLLAIFFGLSATVSWITWMLAVHLDVIEAKSKKED